MKTNTVKKYKLTLLAAVAVAGMGVIPISNATAAIPPIRWYVDNDDWADIWPPADNVLKKACPKGKAVRVTEHTDPVTGKKTYTYCKVEMKNE